MSLLINGMEMSKCCCDCLLYDSAGFCALDPTREFEDYNHKRPDDCLLSEIPTPHGRLIDADELIKQYSVSGEEALEMIAENMEAFRMTCELAKRIRNQINQAPTIIEAEE